MICRRRKIIFIHIPKTGGTSVENLFWPLNKYKRSERNLWMGFKRPMFNKYQTGGLQHLTASLIKREVGSREFAKCFKFTFDRNPWDKVISQYLSMGKRKDLRGFVGMESGFSLKQYLDCISKRSHVQWEEQYKFIEDVDGKSLVDWVGKFESISDDIDIIRSILDLDKGEKLPHVNKSSSRLHYSHYYDLESKEVVGEMYAKDISRFGYVYENVSADRGNAFSM